MTIPSRPAPPPPTTNAVGNNYRIQQSSSTSAITTTGSGSRYTPTTNWDDKPFNENEPQHYNQINNKKMPPPRPPPPMKKNEPPVYPALKKPGSQHSVNILSNLFGSTTKRSKTPPNKINGYNSIHNGTNSIITNGRRPNNLPPKLPPPPGSILTPTSSTTSSGFSSMLTTPSGDYQLIDFHSPPSSPTLTQKSNSDCLSIDSFNSDTNNYYNNNNSPNNGNLSQTESGFEDDFNIDCQMSTITSSSSFVNNKDPWELLTAKQSEQQQQQRVNLIKPPIAQKPVSIGKTSFYAFLSSGSGGISNNEINIDDNPLCNGKTILQQTPITMPTIIRPKTSPTHTNTNQLKEQQQQHHNNRELYDCRTKIIVNQKTDLYNYNDDDIINDDDELNTPPSPPMPNCPPPPPPAEFFKNNLTTFELQNNIIIDEETTDSYGIALYDFEGTQDDDLSFREHEKIYLIKKLDNDWMLGRNRRGCEGMIPINYIDIKVPIHDKIESHKNKVTPFITKPIKPQGVKVKALYNFNAEAAEDLDLKENDDVIVLYEINSEWLYGRIGLKQGQFPANFIEFIPINLPKMPSTN